MRGERRVAERGKGADEQLRSWLQKCREEGCFQLELGTLPY